SKVIRDSDILARLGGDEFVMVLSELSDEKSVFEVMNRILKVMSPPCIINGRSIYQTTSIGVSLYQRDGMTSEELIRNADLAMYAAKREGRNKFQFYTDALNVQSLHKLEQETGLRNALERNEFILHYQPQIDTITGKLFGVEALIRWQHPVQGLISPLD